MRYFLGMAVLLTATWAYGQNCENEDFEFGNTNNWKGYTGYISSAGVVTINTPGFVNDRHLITGGTGMDPVAAGCGVDIPLVEESGLHSMRLGNNNVGGEAERITMTFDVQPGQEFFLYKYAVVLEDPQHNPYEQPRFEVRVFDENGNLAPCGEFKVRAGPNAKNEGFTECNSSVPNQWGYNWTRKYWVKNWTVSGADLSAFVGQKVTIEFLTTDCSRRGHAGYAYVEASCKKLGIDVDGFCPGSNTATLSITEGWKSYKWFNGATSNSTTVTGLQVGDTVSVEVTSFAGCSTTITHVIDSVPAVTMDPLADRNVCKGEKTTLTATGQNVGYFQWNQINERGNTVVVAPDDTTDYIVEAFDLNGCPTGITDTARVHVRGFSASTTAQDVTCNGLSDGQASVQAMGGIPPYTYTWSNGETTAAISGLDPGDYEVTVADSSGLGCSQTLQVSIGQPTGVDLETGSEESQCSLNNGKAWVKATGGIPPYTYLWDYNGSTNDTLTNIPAGTYKVIVKDDNGNGCSFQAEVTVNEPQLITLVEGADARCFPNDGEAAIFVQGGSGTYTYQWSPGNQTTEKITSLTAGTYYVQVTDTYGCIAYDSVTILPPPAPLAGTIAKKDALCAIDDGEARIEVTGGTPPYFYSWSTGSSDSLISQLSAGQYDVTVTDANNCEMARSATILPPPPLLEASVFTYDARCAPNDGWAQVNVRQGTPPYQYLWFPDSMSTSRMDSLEAGYYEVRVTDSNGCNLMVGGSVAPPPPLMEAEVETEGESYGLRNGQASVITTGGVSPYVYTWLPGGYGASDLDGLAAGDYQVTITDQNLCQLVVDVVVDEIPPIEIPNAFTPNGDGQNDDWQLKNIELYPGNTVTLYNRWGKRVWQSNGYAQPWNGVEGGTYLPADTYYYAIDLGIGLKPFAGFVDIIR